MPIVKDNLFERGNPSMSRDNKPFTVLWKKIKSLNQRLLIKGCKLSSLYGFAFEVSWMAPVVARQALYWTLSNLFWKLYLFDLSY